MTKSTQPAGAVCDGGVIAGPFVFRELIIRNNIIRHLDNAPSSATGNGNYSGAVTVSTVENLIVEQNILNVGASQPLNHVLTKSSHYFQNHASSGALIRGALRDTMESVPELADLVQDAIAFALL